MEYLDLLRFDVLINNLEYRYGHTFVLACALIGAGTIITMVASIPWRVYDYIISKKIKKRVQRIVEAHVDVFVRPIKGLVKINK